MGRLNNKRVFLTAAGAGIGRASALAMAREGATVFATDIDEAALMKLANEHESITVQRMDASDGEAIKATAKKCGPVDVLFNCSGFVAHGNILEMEDEEFDFSFNLNVRAHIRTIKAFLPGMIEQGGGSIINMSSAVSSVIGVPNRALYGATKAAVIGLTKSVAKDFVEQGIRCNAICPGTVETPSLDKRIRELGEATGEGYEAARASFIARSPMGKIASPEELAALVVYLASDESQFTTGQAHVICGGWTL